MCRTWDCGRLGDAPQCVVCGTVVGWEMYPSHARLGGAVYVSDVDPFIYCIQFANYMHIRILLLGTNCLPGSYEHMHLTACESGFQPVYVTGVL